MTLQVQNLKIQNLRKKLYYRSHYRGNKEMDQILGQFANRFLADFNYKQLLAYEKMLQFNDSALYRYFLGQEIELNILASLAKFVQQFAIEKKLISPLRNELKSVNHE